MCSTRDSGARTQDLGQNLFTTSPDLIAIEEIWGSGLGSQVERDCISGSEASKLV